MKKVYSKPQIMFENFALSTNIAAGCEKKTNTPSQMNCAYGKDDFDLPIFLEGVSACISKVDEDENSNFCYHVPLDSKNLFNS